uniref:RING-type domain-containing protein n=1 Tax=Glossina brevipalpis TaxID=37001 RepID=A0A1A9WQ84_9MUSC
MSSIKTATILNTAVTSEICSPSNVFTPTIAAKVSSTSTCSSASFCFENAIILSGSSGCSSLSNSPTSSTSTTGSLSSPTPATKILDDPFPSKVVNGEFEEEVLKCPPQNPLLAKFKLSEDNAIKKENDISDEQSQILLDDFSSDFSALHNSRHHHLQQFQSQYQQQQMVHHSIQSLNTDDARTLQLAVELSMMGLKDQMINSQLQQLRFQATENQFPQYNSAYQVNTLSKTLLPIHNTTVLTNPKYTGNQSTSGHFNTPNFLNTPTCLAISEERSKKSQNMTECVPVPSSEHVAEIVGRQGCKIKALRAKTNTYIKTPVRNEEPVFVVTGRKEDVAKAKREILSAAEHFTLIRATRRAGEGTGVHNGMTGVGCIPKNALNGGNGIQGQVTIQVRVPYRVVGLVVGPKGNTIKHIQHETQTYIVTPSRDKEPIFEVTGLPDNVQAARKHIEAHIATRTGGETLGNSSRSALFMPGNLSASPTIHTPIPAPTTSLTTAMSLSHSTTPHEFHLAIGQEDSKDVQKIVNTSINQESVPQNAALQSALMFTTPSSSQRTVSSTVQDELNLHNMLASPLPILQIVPKINTLIPTATSSVENMSLENTPHSSNDESLQAMNTINKIVNDEIHVELLSTIYKTGIESAFESFQQSVGEVVNQLQDSETNSNKELANTLTSLSSSSGHIAEFPSTKSAEIDIEPSMTSTSHPINQVHLNGMMNFHMTTNKADYPNHVIKTSSGFESDLDQQATNIHKLASFMTNGGPVRSISSNAILRNLKSNFNEISNGANNVSALTRSCSSASSTSASSSKSLSQNNSTASAATFWKRVSLGDSTEIDEGIGESPNIWKLPKKLAVVTSSYCPASISPTDQEYFNYSQFRNKPIIIHGPMEHNGKTKIKRDCCICHEKEMVAALIPCGHKMFCVDCANSICSGKEPTCPFCCMRVYQAVKILN